MKSRIRKALVKLLALLLVIILTFPAEVVAQSLNEERKDYTKDTSLMGLNEKDDKDDPGDKSVQNQERKTLLQSDIQKQSLEKLDIEKSVSLSKTTGEIIYKILITNKEDNNEKLGTLQTIFSINKNSKQNDLHIQKITSFDENGNEVEIDAKENKPFFQSDEIKTLSSTSQVEGKAVLYYLSSKIDDETLEEIRAGENYQFALDLLIKNENQEILYQERLAFRNIDKSEENLLDPENPEIIDQENQALDFDLEFIEDIFQVAGEYIDNSKNLLSDKTNEINWTDFIFPNSDSSNEALNYKLIVDENQDTTDSLIKVDFYEASDEGFVINKTYSQEIPYTEETELQIPQGFIAKIALTTKVKEGANPKEFSYNNKIIANPSYEEKEKTSEENKTEEESEDPLPEENKEEQKKENSDKKENTEITETKVEEEEPSDSEDEKEKQTSPIDLNKDALINKYQSQEKLSEDLKAQIDEITKTLNSYNEEKITEEEFRTNLKENSKDLKKEELKEILQSLIAGLNEEKFKVANLPIDEIIAYIYKEDLKEEKEKIDLEKADQELKAALADEKKTIEEIQNLLTSLGEKYQLSREDQEKLMTENDAAIKSLVEKDRNENFRANMLRQLPRKVPSNSWDGKLFHLNLEMNVKATPTNPIPQGWYFDVQLGPYLKEDIGQIWNGLYDDNGRLIASPVYDEAKHTIRYVFQTSVTKDTKLTVDQYLGFDLDEIGQQTEIDIDIKVAPKNNPIQSMPTKHVTINDENPVESSYNVVSQGQSDAKTYPFQLNWTSEQQYNGGSNPTVEWNIEVDTASLKANDLDFNNLNISVFAGAEQGLNNFKFKASTTEIAPDDNKGYVSSARLGEILQKNTSIAKDNLRDKLYIRVIANVDKNSLHDYYSIGLRINPDGNYIKKMLDEFTEEFNKLPAIIKWMKGAEQAKEFSKLPFNLVETMIPAKSTERDNFTSENLYYDSSRTIYAKRDSDTNVDWYALDLLRLGEKPDQALDNPKFSINNSTDSTSITPKVFYYVPQENGLYRRTPDIGAVVTEYNDFYPGTLISYEYDDQKGTRDDTYRFEANIKEKKVNNLVGETTTGGPINLFTKKVSNKDLTDKYLAYIENPYPIMRINKNFDMVQCFNKGTPDPSFKGSDGIFLDIHEDPSGDYLISRLNENVGKKQGTYELVPYLNGKLTDDGIKLNPHGMNQGQAMEDLMKRIYFYGNEVKKEYTLGKFDRETEGEIMHRLIENSMYQRVLHYFTDGISISEDFFDSPKGYNDDSWKFGHTLTGSKNPNGTWSGDQFIGTDESRKTDDGLRKLKDKETIIRNYPIVKNTQEEMANELLKKVIASYKDGSDWSKEKASTVQLVFYSHTKEGEYQELITGRVTEPLEIDKYKNDGKTKLEGAKFTFINKYTNEKVEWTSKKDNNDKLYLKPGYYRVEEEAPSGYTPIKEFEIQVKRSEVNPDHGPYKFKELPDIHVNDGYDTKVVIKDEDVPKSADGKNLVEIDKDNKVKVKLTNIQNNLGDLEFVKKNEFAKLNGAEFTLRKVTAESVDEVKAQINEANINYDNAYRQTSTGYYGVHKFEQIPVGYYILEETNVPAGYQKAPLYILEAKEETVAGKNKVVLHFVGDNIPTQKENNKTVIQNKVKEIEIKIRKVREENKDTTTEHLGLSNAKFTLTSLRLIDGDFYKKEAYTDKTKPTDSSKPKVDGQQASGGGYISFENLKVGEYILQENEAPKGYAKTKLYGWKLVVSELQADDAKTGKKKGDLVYELYEVDKKENINSDKLKKINLDDIKKGDEIVKAFQIGNAPRTIDIPFDKYTSAGGTDEVPVKQNVLLKDNEDNPLEFDLYKADYYGAIISDKPINKHPIVQNKAKQDGNPRKFTDGMYDYSFELHDLEFGGYYVLRERKALKGYRKAGDILLKVEAEAIANEGHMKVIVRNPSVNAHTGDHSIFEGIINYEQGAKLGQFSIKKVGNAIGDYYDENGNKIKVGLRRAYFRLYTADENYNKKKNPNGYYDYIQKVTPGKPITKDDGNGGQIGVNPDELPPEQGIITFDQLKPGHYVLEEYRGPAGYEKDPSKWYISVDKNGIVTKYRENPTKNKNANQVDYSAQSLRYKMSGLDTSEPIHFDNLMQVPSNPNLQEITPYTIDSANANIEVNASAVDTTDGSRDIRVKITPKTKQTGVNKSHWVLLVDRTKDWSKNGAKLDDNINKFLTDLRAKADIPGAEVYVSIIEYSGLAKDNKLVLSKTNIKDLDNAQEYSYTMGTLGLLPNGQYNLNEENVNVKNYLSRAGVDSRSNNVNDGAAKLQEIVNANIGNLTSEKYDHKYVINFATFKGNNAARMSDRIKFLQFESMWAFFTKGYSRVYFHQDQEATELNGTIKDYSDYMSNNADIKELYLTNKNVVKNKNFKKPREFAPYVQKEKLDSILNDTNNFASQGQEESLLKNGILNISTNDKVKLNSYSISKNGNPVENQTNPTSNSINKNINLGIGESLELTYKIKLDASAEDNTEYDIHKLMTYKPDTNENEVNLDPNKLITLRENSTPPAPNTYKITINPSENGSVTASKSTNINKGEEITLTVNPSNGFRLKELKVTDANEKEIQVTDNKFTMPASDVTVNATFEQIPQQGDVDLTTIFTYTNQTDGKDDSKNVPLGNAGRITLQVKQPAQGSNPESWQDLKTLDAPYKGKIDFPDKLDKSKEYRLKYVREENIASVWGSEVTTYININPDNAKNNKLTVTISNGNLTEIFNHDETGFRIPLRITKVNENKAALTGSQFQAKKILNGDRKLYVDILDEKGHKTGKVREAGTADKDPVYHDEKFDGVSEATGEPGDNYFRELTPGIYELTEIKAPDGTYRMPVDDKGNPMKWYFKVFVYKDRQPNGADYMGIDFYFEHTFSENDDWNKDYQITDEEKQALIGTTIKGLGTKDSKFNKYIKVIPDDGRSNPARPDAPYKGINDAEVTNYKNKTKLNFFKKSKENHQNLEGAEFSLRKVKMETVEENGTKVQRIVKDENNKPVIDETESKEEGKRIEPFDEKSQFAKAISDKELGVNFTDIPEGTYILEEIKPAEGYKKIDSFLLIKFTENEDGSWKQEIKGYEKDADGKYQEIANPEKLFQTNANKTELESIYNDKNYIDFKFQKIEGVKDKEGKDIAVDSSDFRVTQVDEEGNPIPGGYDQPIYSYLNSNFTFKKLGVGRYKLQETRALEKYIKPDPWYFRVVQDSETYKLKIVFEEHDASIRFTPENETDGKDTPQLDKDGNPKDIKVANYQKTKFIFKKQDQNGNSLPDVYFNLKKLRQTFDSEAYDYDEVLSATYTYNKSARSQKSGSVTFDTLGEGIYELRETDKPEGYDSNAVQDRWIIKVVKTENGLQAIYDKEFEKKYYAKYEKDGYYQDYIKNKFDEKSNLEQKQVGDFSYILTNTKTTTDLKWKKVNQNKETIAKETKFIMLKNSDDPNNLEVAKSGNSSSPPYELIETDGTFEVNNLSKGVYTLIETKAPDGFKQMNRQIVIQIYEDANDSYKLKKKFYEMKKDANGNNELVEGLGDFTYIFTRNRNTEVDTDGFGYFYVKNDEKQQYFYLTKGFLTDSNGKKVFNKIEKGELKLKLTNTEDDKDVFRTTIDLAKPDSTGYYRFDINGIKTGKTYLLEEEKAPGGYKLSSNKYKLLFVADTQNPGKVIAILKSVLDKDGNELKNEKGQLILEDGTLVDNFNAGTPIQVINEKNKIEFTKVGKDRVKGEDGKFKDQEDPLKDVEFILQKQDPKDFYKENNGYYPVTKDIEFIKKDDKGLYILRADGRKDYKVGVSNVTIDNSAYKGKSDDKGKFTFEGLTDGFYQIMEPNAPEGFMQVNGPVKKFRVLEGKIYIYDKVGDKFVEKEVTDDNIGTLGKIINEKPGKGEFKLTKYTDLGNPMEKVKFELFDTTADQTKKAEGTTDSNGEIHFQNLPYGYYWLVETKTKDGYILDTRKRLVSLGGDKEWNVPEKNTDVSDKINFAKSQADLESTTGNKGTFYPNKEEAIVARFKLEFENPEDIKPGNHFTLKLTDDVDIDGIVKDNDGNGKSDPSLLNLIGPAGVLAKAEVDENRHTITYTFTDYVGEYTPKDMELFLQLYPNREKLVEKQTLDVTANIGDSKYSKSINVDYRSSEGYQDPDIDVSSYMLRLEPGEKTFTAIVYYNQWNRMLTDKGIEFILDKNVDKDSLKVKTYKRIENGKAIAGSHSDVYQTGDLPDSYGINPSVDKLQKVGEKFTLQSKYYQGIFGTSGNMDTITVPYSYLNKGYYIEGTNTVNDDPMDTTYVIEIKGKLTDENVKSLKTQVQYNHKINWYGGYNDYGYWDNNLLVGRYYAGAFRTWSQFYTPGGEASAAKEMQVINFRNRIDFVKIDGGVRGEVADTIPDEEGNIKESSIFTNDIVGEALAGAKFKLKKSGEDAFIEGSEKTSDDRGRFSWVGLSPGTYEVWETEAPKGYKKPTKMVSQFVVDKNGNITISTGYKEIIENNKTAKIKIKKVDQEGNSIAGDTKDNQADFTLEGINVKNWNSPTESTGKDGYAVFEDIPFGNFELKESKPPKGYTSTGKTWKLTVAKDGRIAWTNSFDDEVDKLKAISETSQKSASANLETKIVGIDKTKKVFRQYNLIKANKDDLKANKITITSPDTSIKLNQDNTRIRLVAIDSKSNIDNLTPTKDDADYQVKYNGNSMDVSIKLPEEKKNTDAVGSEQGGETNQKTYLVIVDMPYNADSKVGAKVSYNNENVEKTVEEKSITEGNTNHDLSTFRNKDKNYYRPRLVNDLDLIIENIKNPDIYFKKVDSDNKEALAGAEFEIQKKNENDEYKAIGKNGKEAGLLNPKWTSTSDGDGHFGFSDIPDGEYQIEETKAPSGYTIIKKDPYLFKVEKGKIYKFDENSKKYEELTDNKAETPIQITNRKATYPQTGGPGVWIGFSLIGLAVMITGVLIYGKRKQLA